MKAFAPAYPSLSLSRSLPSISIASPPSLFSIKFLNRRRRLQVSQRALKEEEEEEEGEEEDERGTGKRKYKGKGTRKAKPSVSASRLPVEYVEAMTGAVRKRRGEGKVDAEPFKPTKPEIKDWESMNLQEKLIQIYVGEKGILFWLNKLAYASIFIVVGGWVLFRFVGPSLGLYHLQSSLLEPTKVLGGGS